MDLKAAEGAITEWERRLAKARAVLAQHEDDLGTLALSGRADKALEKLKTFQNDVQIAEQALAAAHRQREAVRDQNTRQHIQDLLQQMENAAEVAAQHGAVLAELGPKFEQARREFEFHTQRHILIGHQVESLEDALRQRGRKRDEEARRQREAVAAGGRNSWSDIAGGMADARGANYDPGGGE